MFWCPWSIDAIPVALAFTNTCEIAMPDRAIAMGESKTRLHQFSIDLIEETELHRIGGVGPDGEVAPLFCQGGS
jgi:hypothetical protein